MFACTLYSVLYTVQTNELHHFFCLEGEYNKYNYK